MGDEILFRLLSAGSLSHLDFHFARFMGRLAGGTDQQLLMAAALVSASARNGHICLDLSQLGETLLLPAENGDAVRCPNASEWRRHLLKTPVIGRPGDQAPLILDDQSRLYLYRYWEYQTFLVDAITKRLGDKRQAADPERLRESLGQLFPPQPTGEIDWQKVAAFAAAHLKFMVISGGPGTGKTTTVAKILALLAEQWRRRSPRIALAAPTGKAVARLREAIKQAKQRLDCSEEVKDAIPEEASTIHRLLGSIPGSPYFRHNAEDLLPLDVAVVDEASMVDLALMAKLFQALPADARVILLGDKDQLASVEAGAVLGDICDTGHVHGYSKRFVDELQRVTGYDLSAGSCEDAGKGLGDSIIELRKSYRFGTGSGIGVLSRAVNVGNAAQALAILQNEEFPNVRRRKPLAADSLGALIKKPVIEGFEHYLQTREPLECFSLFDRFRILCAVREGPWGVKNLNRLAEKVLAAQGLIRPDARWYRGRPVMIRINDYNLRLFNGDVGIALSDPESGGELRVFFPGGQGTVRKFHPLRLPEHETVFAMTVHKSQGSEFDRVLLILPDRDTPVLTRELLYTAITRAREDVEIWAQENVFTATAARRTERMSGLRDALWADP